MEIVIIFYLYQLPASFFKMENSGVLWIINVPCCLEVTKEKVSYSEINSGCDFRENIEELHKPYPIGMYLLKHLFLEYRADLGIFHSINTLCKLKHFEKHSCTGDHYFNGIW